MTQCDQLIDITFRNNSLLISIANLFFSFVYRQTIETVADIYLAYNMT